MEETPSNSTEDSKIKICGLCDQNVSKYCCPRCDVLYCSLDCYKSDKHLECSESFYRDCINEELTYQHADDASRHQMIDILKRMNDNDESLDDIDIGNAEGDDDFDSDDNNEDDLGERIKNLDLNDADALWNVLTDDERNEFEALLNKGDVGAIMPHWEPWWMGKKEKKLVKDVDECADELSRCPEILEVPKLIEITNVKPSPAIIFNITNVLSSYVFVIRYFNGDIDPVEAVVYLLNICANMDTNTNFEDIATAVESVAQRCLQSELIQTDEISLNVMRHDTHLILEGPSDDNKKYYCQAALSHINKIFSDAKKAEKSNKKDTDKRKEVNGFSKKFPEHNQSHLPKLDVSKVKKCIKKIEYYLSYLLSYGMNIE